MKFNFGSTGKKKNTKAARLRKMESQIKKLENKRDLDRKLKAAAAKLKQLKK